MKMPPMAIDRQKLDKEYIFTGRGTAAELTVEMDRVAALQKKLKARTSFIRWLALAVFLVLAAAAAFGGAGFIVLGILAAIGVLIYSGASAPKIVPDRVEFLRLILNTLSRDAGQGGRFQVLLRLCRKREKLSEAPNPRSKSGKQILLRDTWLSVGGRLSDGTSISESCTDLIRQRTKKTARGKTKTKERIACLMRVQLEYNAERYGNAAIAAHAMTTPFRLPGETQMKAFSSDEKALAMKAIVKSNPTTAQLHAASEAMLLGAYRILNLARQRVLATGGAK
jgi:hypothetical protein